ncbi:hypothetical protein A4A49_63357 [Nicotiana attenuata]|uniref:CCHC-type domain-containing protein n=1 Tax=Nicotiana attenuata TaxID=49451 RepID=A0A314KSS2_NICAT|nr:hypothetical protein A4A49_63357 [Nicotiana attenuata]
MAGGNAELREKVVALEALVGTVNGDQFLTIVTRLAYIEAEMTRLSQEYTDLRTKNGLLRRAVGTDEAQRGADRTKVEIPEPKEFNGARSAKKLENFLWDMEQYFHAAKDNAKEWRNNGNDKGNAVEGNGNEKGKQCAGPSTKWGQNSKFDGCFICKGPHMARDCPRIEKLSALSAEEKCEDEPNEAELEQTTAYVGPMVVLKNGEPTSSRTTNSSGGGSLLAP